MRRDPSIAVLPVDHPLTARDRLRVGDLLGEDFIAHAAHGASAMAELLRGVRADAGFTPRVRHEVQETSTLVTMVAAGLGVAIVSAPVAALEIAGAAFRPLVPAALGIDLTAAWLAERPSPVIEQTVNMLRRLLVLQREGGPR